VMASPAAPARPRRRGLRAGTDFAGGAASLFGSSKAGEDGVNHVYARPNGDRAAMRASFTIIPLLTCADYAWNPRACDPARSIGQAIVHLAERRDRREVLRDLVESYPGMLAYGLGDTGFKAVREQYRRIAAAPHSRQAAAAWIRHLEGIASRLEASFPDRYAAEKKTLMDDIRFLEGRFAGQYEDEVED